ncbi:MAG TPA: hypothetical protein VI758_02755 [Bacteroidota bacterium]
MSERSLRNNQDPVAVIESLMAQERANLEKHRTDAFASTEPKMKSLFSRLAEIHSGIYAELRTVLDDLKSRRAITEQINDMFR